MYFGVHVTESGQNCSKVPPKLALAHLLSHILTSFYAYLLHTLSIATLHALFAQLSAGQKLLELKPNTAPPWLILSHAKGNCMCIQSMN